jgi:hypothetical protein
VRAIESQAGQMSHPTIDHYLPLVYAVGAPPPKTACRFRLRGSTRALCRCGRFSSGDPRSGDRARSFYRGFRRLRAGRVLSPPAPPHVRSGRIT